MGEAMWDVGGAMWDEGEGTTNEGHQRGRWRQGRREGQDELDGEQS